MIQGRQSILHNLGDSIIIEPFNQEQLNENSYDVRLGQMLIEIEPNHMGLYIDPKEQSRGRTIRIPESGFLLTKGKLYLGHTIERIGSTKDFVPMLTGRSSFARIGLVPELAAGFGDVGFCQQWTLELMALAHPVKVYPGMRLAQVYWERVEGGTGSYKERGTYSKQEGPTLSGWWKHHDKR